MGNKLRGPCIVHPSKLHVVFASTVGTPRIIATAPDSISYVHGKRNLAVKVFYTRGRKSGGGSRNGQ
jgi:hypothetical protein